MALDQRSTRHDGPAEPEASGAMAGVVDRNIAALLERRRQNASRQPPGDRIAQAITDFTGSILFVFVHLVIFTVWIVWNLGWLGLPPFDSSFVVLAMAASVEAIFLSTFVLISQNRMNAEADERADLDLQISLLTEHEVTRLITLTTALVRDAGLAEAEEPEISELEQDVHPEQVLDFIEQHDAGESGEGQ